MCDTGYSIKGLVADLRELRLRVPDEAGMILAVPDLARRLLRYQHNWLRDSMCVPDSAPGRAGTFMLHEEPDHSLAIVVVTWLPGEETPPHDHGTWAVIAGLRGRETNHWWKRMDDGRRPGYAEVRRDGLARVEPDVVIAMGARRIHSVQNDSKDVSVSLHIYGMHVDHTERCKFDPEKRTSSPYAFGGTLAPRAAA
jgi:predicted metal-dependent enzyme (double-stranded beta helix superfamily)